MISDISLPSFIGTSNAILLALCASITLLLYRLARPTKVFAHLPGPPRGSWMSGNIKDLLGPNSVRYQDHLAATYGPTAKIASAFGEEIIWSADPAFLHVALVKDRPNFTRPDGTYLLAKSIFGGGLVGMEGDAHRVQRKILNPVFTMKFLRELMPIFTDIARQTRDAIKRELSVKPSSKEIDVFPWMTVAALELVGEAGLGYSFDSFTGQRNEYNIAAKSVLRVLNQVEPYVGLLPYAYRVGTAAFRRWAVQYLPIGGINELIRAVKIQNEQAEEVIRARQDLIAAGEDLSAQAGRGRDIMTLLMKANEAEGSENHITRQELIGHMNLFVFAGHETTSTALSRILDMLAEHTQVQVKLREELRQYFEEHGDDTKRDALLELPYLDAVVRETLRLHSPSLHLFRMAKEDTVVPLQYPIETANGKITSLPVKKGTRLILSLTSSNRYPKIWGERSHEFWPERWLGKRLDEVTPGVHLPGVYSSMMSFGAGPAACIGFKFALMEIKVMISELLTNFKFEKSQHNPSEWQAFTVQFPYKKSELENPDKLPKLMLRVLDL